MDNILERIKNNFSDSIQTKINTADSLISEIGYAAQKIVQCLLDGHKIMSCGNDGSAYGASHFSNQMINQFKHERPSLPTIALTSNSYNHVDIFAKQIRALGHTGDILFTLSTSGNSLNVVHAIKAAQDRQMNVIALTGGDGGKIAGLLEENDVEIRVPASDKARIQETHLLIIHCLCDIIDNQLFGHGDVTT